MIMHLVSASGVDHNLKKLWKTTCNSGKHMLEFVLRLVTTDVRAQGSLT